MKAMLTAQAEYFQARKLGYSAENNQAKSITQEAATRQLFKHLHHNRPKIIEAEIKGLVDGYNKFLDRCKVLLVAQHEYFEKHEGPQLKKCKALEKEMRNYIKNYLEKPVPETPTLF
jgi:hypothetical protein